METLVTLELSRRERVVDGARDGGRESERVGESGESNVIKTNLSILHIPTSSKPSAGGLREFCESYCLGRRV